MKQITVKLDEGLEERLSAQLDRLAGTRPVWRLADVVRQALDEYLSREEACVDFSGGDGEAGR